MNLSGEAETNEITLIQRARERDASAWEALVSSHQEPVFRLSYLLLGDADEAEDNAQETFLRAYRALKQFDTSRPLRPWLMSIAANQARNRRRSLARYLGALQRLVTREPPQAGAASSPSAEAHSTQRSQSQSLWQAVQELPNDQQRVIYLRYFLELSVEETAQAMGTAPGTVKSRLHRALNRLRAVIDTSYPALKEWQE